MRWNQNKIIFGSLVGMLVCYTTSYAVSENNSKPFFASSILNDKSLKNVQKIFRDQKNVSLNIFAPAANIYINPSDGNDVLVNVEKKIPFCDLEIHNSKGNVTVKYPSNNDFVFMQVKNDCTAIIMVTVPTNSSIVIKTVNGESKINGDYSSIQLSSVNGNLKFSGKSDSVNLHTVSGDINVKGLNKHLIVQSISGNVKLHYDTVPMNSDLQTDTVSGNVNITLPKGTQLSHTFHSISGSFSENDVLINRNATFLINAKSVSGGVSIN
jgi:DUF4097 and DUF4098 domain-containing protein YvlB